MALTFNSNAARLARVQRLLRERAAPRELLPRKDGERVRRVRTYLFAEGAIPRLALLLICTTLAGSAASALLPASVPNAIRLPLSAALLVTAVQLRDSLWALFGDALLRLLRNLKLAALGLATVVILLLALAPDSGLARSFRAAGDEWVEGRRAALDRKQASLRIPLDSLAAHGDRRRIVTADGIARLGTLSEARGWCSALGNDWTLPPAGSLDIYEPMERWPRLPRTVSAWTLSGAKVQIGSGARPMAWSQGTVRATETAVVWCLKLPEDAP